MVDLSQWLKAISVFFKFYFIGCVLRTSTIIYPSWILICLKIRSCSHF